MNNSEDDDTKTGEQRSGLKGSLLSVIVIPLSIICSLSVHSIFEGIATGLASDVSDCLTLVIAIVAHKWAAAMSLGFSLISVFEQQKIVTIIMIIIFSLSTPLGVLIGALISEDSDLVTIIFNSLAAGTFVYIACSEIIIREMEKDRCLALKAIMVTVGIVIITLITTFASH